MAVKARADATLTGVQDGEDGAQGASVASVTTFWQLASSQPATPTGTADPSGWGKTIPTVAEGYTGSLWVTYRSVISDGTTSTATYTAPAKDSSYEYAQRCWQLEDGTYATARTLKSATDAVSTTLSKSYTTTDGMRSAISSAVTQTASDLTAEFAAVVGGRNLLLGTSSPLTPEGNGGTNQNGGAYYYACGGFAKLDPSTTYTLSYTLKSSAATTGTVLLQLNAKPWDGYGTHTPTTTATRHSLTFTTPATSTSTATGVMMRMDGIPATVTVTLSDVQLERGATATAWTPSPQDASTLIRQSGDGVEVARKVNGAYTGTRAVLDSDSLDFKDSTGATVASFGAAKATLGATGGQYVRIENDSFNIVDSGTTRLSVYGGANGTMMLSKNPISIFRTATDSSSYVDLNCNNSGKTGYVSLSAVGTTGSGTVQIDSTGRFMVSQTGNGADTIPLTVTPTAISCGALKAASVGSTTLVSGKAYAYRHMGVVYLYLNAHSFTSALTGSAATVGTLPAGWRPPAMVKGGLYAGSQEYAAQVSVDAAGAVKVYSSNLPKGQQVSGYVIYPATQ